MSQIPLVLLNMSDYPGQFDRFDRVQVRLVR